MGDVKKINLWDATKERVYHDEFGWVNSKISVTAHGKIQYDGIERQNTWNDRSLYVKQQEKYVRLDSDTITNRQRSRHDLELYVCGSSYPCGNYFKIEELKVSFSWKRKEIDLSSQIDIYEGIEQTEYLKDFQIQKGLAVRKTGGTYDGTYIVTEMFEQPDRENRLCTIDRLIKANDINSAKTVYCHENVLVCVPYETYEDVPDEVLVFNQPLCEGLLAPFIEKTANESKDANLYWLPIEEASGYTVSLYKKRLTNDVKHQKHKIYLLERFEIDRNKHWFTLHDLIGKGYIIILEAENRQGEIIARTRGINLDTEKLEWF